MHISERLWLLLIIAVGACLRAAAIGFFDHAPESDELAYRSMALNLVAGNGIVDNMGNKAMYNVGYPLFVLAPVFYFLGENLLAARLANLGLGLIAIVLCHWVAREAGAGRLGRLLAAAAWALYLPASVYTVYLNKENLMVPLMLGVVGCALRLSKTPSPKAAALCGLLFGLLALAGNAALSLAAAAGLALVLSPARVGTKIGLGAACLVAALLVSSPWMARNAHVIGAPVLNTNGGFNLYLGNNPAATGWFVSIADTPRGPTWERLRKTGEVQASQTLRDEAVAWIRTHPADFVGLALKKAVFFWAPPLHPSTEQASRAESAVRLAWLLQYLVLIVGALAALFLAQLRNRSLALLFVAIAGYALAHTLFYVIFRYREPIMPLLCVLTGLTLEAMLAKRSLSRRLPFASP